MAWRVTWTQPALEDLQEIADYIAADSKFYAAAFAREIRDAARSLSEVLVIALIHGARDLASLWARYPRSVDDE